MKKSISPKKFALGLCLLILSSSCASFALPSVPALEQRTLLVSKDSPSLYFQYDICVKKFLGICTKSEPTRDLYDLTNKEVRAMLRDKGFVMKIAEKVLQ